MCEKFSKTNRVKDQSSDIEVVRGLGPILSGDGDSIRMVAGGDSFSRDCRNVTQHILHKLHIVSVQHIHA